MPHHGYSTHSIPDPHSGIEPREYVCGRIDRKVFFYFFKQVLPGERGPRNAMIATFFQRFYEACNEAGINPVWDEGNEEKVNNVLQRLNFNVPMPPVQRTVAARKTTKP